MQYLLTKQEYEELTQFQEPQSDRLEDLEKAVLHSPVNVNSVTTMDDPYYREKLFVITIKASMLDKDSHRRLEQLTRTN